MVQYSLTPYISYEFLPSQRSICIELHFFSTIRSGAPCIVSPEVNGAQSRPPSIQVGFFINIPPGE